MRVCVCVLKMIVIIIITIIIISALSRMTQKLDYLSHHTPPQQ